MCEPLPALSVQVMTPFVTLAVPTWPYLPVLRRCQRTTVPDFDGPPLTVTLTRWLALALALIFTVDRTWATTALLVAPDVFAWNTVFREMETVLLKSPVVASAVTVAKAAPAL